MRENAGKTCRSVRPAGIDVITVLERGQHIDSLNDAVEAVTGTAEHETVPDAVVRAVDEIESLEITPQQSRAPLHDTDVLRRGAAPNALTGFDTVERVGGAARSGDGGGCSNMVNSGLLDGFGADPDICGGC